MEDEVAKEKEKPECVSISLEQEARLLPRIAVPGSQGWVRMAGVRRTLLGGGERLVIRNAGPPRGHGKVEGKR